MKYLFKMIPWKRRVGGGESEQGTVLQGEEAGTRWKAGLLIFLFFFPSVFVVEKAEGRGGKAEHGEEIRKNIMKCGQKEGRLLKQAEYRRSATRC